MVDISFLTFSANIKFSDWLCVKKNYTIMDLYEGGSKKVLKLNENGKDLILKMDHSFAHEYEYPDPRVDDEEFTDKVWVFIATSLEIQIL